ncbi:MAG TPA: acyl-CoA dehydrogenase family protein, partial [Thermoanaerobaculia bacterium]|nr:acyl-CoA dehydrogenase family protein [Thermoanaerobaculia bacterium]
MDLSLGPEHEALRAEARAFLEAHRAVSVTEREEMADRARTLAWQRLLVEHGYAAREVPSEYGGFGAAADPLAELVIQQEFARAGISTGLRNQGIDMFVPTALRYGTEEQKRRFVPPTLRGELIWCQGYSEPGAGSDLASLRTAARVDGDDYVVDGHKIWTSTAKQAHWMFALVRTDPDAVRSGKKHAGITYLVLPMTTPGIEVRPLRTMTGEAIFNEVFFTGVRVPRENVIGQPGQGWEVATYLLRFERGMLGSPLYSRRLFRGCVDVLRDAGKLGDTLFLDRLMRLEARLLAMEHHGMRLLTDRIERRESGVSGLIVKLVGCQLNYDICRLAIDAMGVRGLLRRGAPSAVDDGFWQDTAMMSLGLIIGGGTAQIQKNIIAEAGLGLP